MKLMNRMWQEWKMKDSLKLKTLSVCVLNQLKHTHLHTLKVILKIYTGGRTEEDSSNDYISAKIVAFGLLDSCAFVLSFL